MEEPSCERALRRAFLLRQLFPNDLFTDLFEDVAASFYISDELDTVRAEHGLPSLGFLRRVCAESEVPQVPAAN
jgi:hypothetical protein